MLKALLPGLALLGAIQALPVEKQAAEAVAGTYPYLPVNGGWVNFPFGPVGSVTPIAVHLFCPGQLNITDLYCSGDRFAVYDNGVFLGNTSVPVLNNCTSNSTNPDYTQAQGNWSHGSFDLLPGWHNISVVVLSAPYYGDRVFAARVDTGHHHHHHHHHHHVPCSVDVCPVKKGDLVVVRTPVPRCQAEAVCKSLGMHLANIDIHNFLEATTLAYQCSGPFSQSWIDDWNGDEYHGTCLVLSTGGAAPGGAINVPSCCNARLPVICQKNPCRHPPVHYSCNSCQSSCYCKDHERRDCHHCDHGKCKPSHHCGLLM